MYGKTILQTTLGRKRWAVRAEGLSTKSFSSLHSIKISTSTPKGGESTCMQGKESVLKITKKFRELLVLRDPCKYHYSSQIVSLLNQDCENSPERMRTHTHTEDSVSHCADIWKFRLAATNSSEAFTVPPGISGHLIQAPVHLGAWPAPAELIPQEGTSSEEANDLRTNTQVSPPSVPASPRWRRSHPEETPGRWSRTARPRPQGCAWLRAGPHGAGPSRPVCASSGARASCGRSSTSCHCGTKRKRGQCSPTICSQTNGVV